MKYSLTYNNSHKQEAFEIKHPWNRLNDMAQFMKDHPQIRINLQTGDNVDLAKLKQQVDIVKTICQDYTISCKDVSMMRELLAASYYAYLAYPVCDWETFIQLRDAGVSDIYIDGPLGFCAREVQGAKQGALIRVSPTFSANLLPLDLPTSNANSFFIRPEDVSKYEGFVDIIDFNQQEKEETLYEIYQRGIFAGDLNLLVPQVTTSVPNLYIRPEFADSRLNCQQDCKNPSRARCQLCDKELSYTNLVVDYFKQEEK